MDLITLLRHEQLAFIHDESHAFKPDNPQVRCVFAPKQVQYNPPILCHYALITRAADDPDIEWNAHEYDLIAKVTNNTHSSCLYALKRLKLVVDVSIPLKQSLSQYNRACSLDFNDDSVWKSTYISTCHEYSQSAHPDAYSVLFASADDNASSNTTVDHNKFTLIVYANTSVPKTRVYSYQFWGKTPSTILTNDPLFATLNQWERLKTLKIKILTLKDKPNRRIGLMKQLDDAGLPYNLFYGCVGSQASVTSIPSDHALNAFIQPDRYSKLRLIKAGEHEYIYNTLVRSNGNKLLTAGEIGCAVSHLQLYEELLSHKPSEAEYYLILEDDAHIDQQQRLFQSLRRLPLSQSFDVCYMHNEATWWAPLIEQAINDTFICVANKSSVNLSLAYIITHRGCLKLKHVLNTFIQPMLRVPASHLKNIASSVGILALPSDDLISHAARSGMLTAITPFVRCISSQHLPSHIGAVNTEAQ